jgi:UDP-3-O-[3-hydroxymyristoyl] glucosamine N-acyltransferase
MQITVAEIGTLLRGEVVGNGQALVSKVAKIEEGEPGALSFLANPKYESHIYETKSTAVLVNKDFKPSAPVSAAMIRVDDAYASFTALLEQFASISLMARRGVHATAVVPEGLKAGKDIYIGALACIEDSVTIGDNVKIFPQVYIAERAKIGNNVVIYQGAKIYSDTVIGDNCIIHAGVVIGSDGFGFAPLPDRSYKKIPQIGNVVIEQDVEIGANTVIDRATMGSTVIRKGVKLDNLVQIAHNVEIGEHTVIASQSGVAGSTKIGKYCIIAGQVGFVGHITVADGSVFGAQSGISGSIRKPNEKWFGTPAFEYKDSLKSSVHFKNLGAMEQRIRELERIIKDLQK